MADPKSALFPSDEDLEAAGWVRRSRRNPLIFSTPRVGQCFWVDFPHDAYEPEFVGEHPGVVVRAAQSRHDTCVIVPLTSRPQGDVKHKHRLNENPNPKGQKAGVECWAICHHLYTIHIARLRPFLRSRDNQYIYPKVSDTDREAIFAAIRSALHHVFPASPLTPEPLVAPASQHSRQLGPNTLTLKKPVAPPASPEEE